MPARPVAAVAVVVALAAAVAASAPAADVTYSYLGNGYITAGGDVERGSMTLAAAEALCTSLPDCCAITWEGADPAPPGNVSLILKSQSHYANDTAWQSYVSSRPCPPPCVNDAGEHGACGPGFDQCGAPFDAAAPQFHVRDKSCPENDPNFASISLSSCNATPNSLSSRPR